MKGLHYSHSRNNPAFPTPVFGQERDGEVVTNTIETVHGMTLRDYFAARLVGDVFGHFSWKDEEVEKACRMVWKLADELMYWRDE